MKSLERQPLVAVGLVEGAETSRFVLKGAFRGPAGEAYPAGEYVAAADGAGMRLGERAMPRLELEPAEPGATFVLRDVVIGIDFHWERKQDQEFEGALRIESCAAGRLRVVNTLPVEAYLRSVISSEMSATSHPELLKAHAIISRSWLLAQMPPWKQPRAKHDFALRRHGDAQEWIRWYDQESHAGFDVCADDHCQRYQGVTRATTPAVAETIARTVGQVLTFDGALCDARFSKSCGGMTERFSAAWEDREFPYLQASYDGEQWPADFAAPLTVEANAAAWIRLSPPAFCNTHDPRILQRILPDFDQETTDFYRWRASIEQDELQAILRRKIGVELGAVRRIEPLARAASGRIIRLRIAGERDSLVIGKELEIRRALSPSHLYSSAFVVEPEGEGVPERFRLRGAGWGHGVGLCQIGAALMAERGHDATAILRHYYRGAELFPLYAAAL